MKKMSQMNIKMIVIITLISILAIVGATYAFFTASITNGDQGSSIIVKTGTLTLTYAEGLVSGEIVLPGDVITKSFSVENTGDVATDYDVYFSELLNDFSNKNDLVYSVSCSSVLNGTQTVSGTCDGVSETVLPSTSSLMLNSSQIGIGITHNYLITVTFKETGSNQNENQGKNAQFKISINEYSDLVKSADIIGASVQVGDWISYDAGSYTTTLSSVDGSSYSLFYGNVSGRSRSNAIDCTNSLAALSSYNGWRVISVDGEQVTLVSGGTPICYKNSWNNTTDYNNITTHDYSEFINSTYAESASILSQSLIEDNVLNATTTFDGGFYDSNMSVLRVGTRYFLPIKYQTQYLLYVQSGGYIGNAGGQSYGIRPTVVLKKNLYVSGGSGTQTDPYTIGLEPQVSNTKGTIVSYWENWTSTYAMKLRTVPIYYDVVTIGFATQGASTGQVTFALDADLGNLLNGYTSTEFKSDIQKLKNRGQKVVLSIGGAEANIVIDSTSAVNNFVSSVESIVDEYGFDGIDINFENTIYPTYLASGINSIATHYGSDFMINMAPETVDIKANSSGVISGKYYDLLSSISNNIDLVNVQLYNTGDQYGMDGIIYYPGTVDFITAELQVIKSSGVPASKIGMLMHSLSSKTGYVLPSTAIDGYNSFVNGGLTINGEYTVPSSNPDFNTIGIYSIHNDRSNDFAYTKAIRNIFK